MNILIFLKDYYQCVGQEGAILFAVFRGKVSEGMDFRDHQARAVVTVSLFLIQPIINLSEMFCRIHNRLMYNYFDK